MGGDMKESPYNNNSKPPVEKFPYLVTLDGEEYYTKATTPESAISNAAFRHAQELNEPVALVKWKINQGKIDCEVEEV